MVLAIGTRLQDFTTASRTLIDAGKTRLIQLNVARPDATKHDAQPFVSDARLGLETLQAGLLDWRSNEKWQQEGKDAIAAWNDYYEHVTSTEEISTPSGLPVSVRNVVCELIYKSQGTRSLVCERPS